MNQSNDSMAALVEGAAKDNTNKAPVRPFEMEAMEVPYHPKKKKSGKSFKSKSIISK